MAGAGSLAVDGVVGRDPFRPDSAFVTEERNQISQGVELTARRP